MSADPNHPLTDSDVRAHSYDGIQEYNHRLPNWWLFTLYGAIVFWIGYWSYYEWFKVAPEGPAAVTRELSKIEAARLAASAAANLDDKTLWDMSRNADILAEGKAVVMANCTPCHLASLRGKSENPQAIGPDLTDQIWIHGGHPTDLLATVTNGVPAKGMPTWGPVLGAKRVSQAVAYVLSFHKEGEPIIDAATVPAK
jgi:cytochrome c oxidase cbb3-type subunit III